METITLYIQDKTWMARHSDPKIKELFGTDTIRTPFTDQASPTDVLTRLEELNPDRRVVILRDTA